MSLGLESLRVLLADDNPHMRAIVMTLLHSFGVRQVREVRDGGEGVEVVRDWALDVAIVDLKMAPVDGVEFTRRVRTSPDSRNPYLPIIMMTGHSAHHQVVKARDAGVTEFIAKPVTAKTLLNRIYSVIYKPRPFIHSQDYFGPDRRRKVDPNYYGPLRRTSDRGARAYPDHRPPAAAAPPPAPPSEFIDLDDIMAEGDLTWTRRTQ